MQHCNPISHGSYLWSLFIYVEWTRPRQHWAKQLFVFSWSILFMDKIGFTIQIRFQQSGMNKCLLDVTLATGRRFPASATCLYKYIVVTIILLCPVYSQKNAMRIMLVEESCTVATACIHTVSVQEHFENKYWCLDVNHGWSYIPTTYYYRRYWTLKFCSKLSAYFLTTIQNSFMFFPMHSPRCHDHKLHLYVTVLPCPYLVPMPTQTL